MSDKRYRDHDRRCTRILAALQGALVAAKAGSTNIGQASRRSAIWMREIELGIERVIATTHNARGDAEAHHD